jgi:hypothetical protein
MVSPKKRKVDVGGSVFKEKGPNDFCIREIQSCVSDLQGISRNLET